MQKAVLPQKKRDKPNGLPPTCRVVFVGNSVGNCSMGKLQINVLLTAIV